MSGEEEAMRAQIEGLARIADGLDRRLENAERLFVDEHSPGALVSRSHLDRVVAALTEQIDARHRELKDDLRHAVSDGVSDGILTAMKDDEFVKRFWRRGYDEVAAHGRDDVSRGIGRRVLTWVAGILFSLGVYLAVKAGVIK